MTDASYWAAYGLDPRSGIGDEAGWSIAEQLAAHEELHWGNIELRTIDRRPLAELSSAQLERTTQAVLEAGIAVTMLDSAIGNWARPVTGPFEYDVRELRILAAMATALGAPLIRIMAYPSGGLDRDSWRPRATERVVTLARIAEEEGVVLALENCVGWGAGSVDDTLELLETVGSPALGLLFDIGNPIVDSYDGLAYLEHLADRVIAIHVKDATVDPDGEPRFTMLGEGEARVVDCLALAFESGYRGYVAIEPHVQHVIHLGADAPPDRLRDSYVEYARRFEGLLEAALTRAGLRPEVSAVRD